MAYTIGPSVGNVMLGTGLTTSLTDAANNSAQIGRNSGSIIYRVEGQTEIPTSPSSFIPFPRDPYFVDRGTLLSEIHERCSTKASWTALVGLGGVGKSQLAIEYAHRLHDVAPDTWIFWIHAGNEARFEQSFLEIADLVKIPERRGAHTNVFKLVYDWLRDRKNGKWLLILDSLDDVDYLVESHRSYQTGPMDRDNGGQPRRLVEYIPRNSNGSVLITTRDKRAGLELKLGKDGIIMIELMDETQAVALLTKRLKKIDVHENCQVVDLAKALEFMPLAMVQAAAYISNLRYSIQQYLDKFRESERKKEKLLDYDEDLGFTHRDWEAQNTIARTWKISFDHIHRTRRSAANLLSLMSFFDPQGIPKTLLRNRPATGHDSQNPASSDKDDDDDDDDDDDFRKDVHMLENYSFISVIDDMANFKMHGLVQFGTRKWLRDHRQMKQWKMQFITNLCKEFPHGKYENWAKCQALFPHVKLAFSQEPRQDQSLREWATIMHRGASFAWTKGNAADAEKMSIKATEAWRKTLGQDHHNTLCSMNLTGLVDSMAGEMKKAEKIHGAVREISSRVYGPEHSNTLASMSNLALTYSDQGRWTEAERLQVQVTKAMKRALGPESLDTLTCMANLVGTYMDQSRWKEAEQLGIQVIETCKKTLAFEHPEALLSMRNLASTYDQQGRWTEAEEFTVQVTKVKEKVLGPEHPDTLDSISNLGVIYGEQGRWKEAEQLCTQVTKGYEKVFGVEHPSTLLSKHNLACVYCSQGRWTEAEKIQAQVLELRKSVLGSDHPSTLVSMDNLVATYEKQGRWEEAEVLGVLAMETRREVLGPEHPLTLISATNVAWIYHHRGRLKEAKELGKQMVGISKRVMGAGHPTTLVCVQNLVLILKDQGEDEQAIELMVELVQGRQEALGPEHPVTKESQDRLNGWCMEKLCLNSSDEDV